tara:strand:+ start:708 stop:995 length:288 start_codon:yes stop_codon:yes gene_type:complete
MFENYGRGDLAQYLESKGYYVAADEDLQALRIASELDAQARAFATSALVREVTVNAQRIMRETINNPSFENVRQALYSDGAVLDGHTRSVATTSI